MHCVSRGGSYLVNSYCDIQEENQWKKESYEACWVSLVLETRPQYKLTLSETDIVRRESYKQQQVIHFLVERSPSQTLRLGSSRNMAEHQLPLSNTSSSLHTTTKQKPVIQEKGNNEEDKQEVTAITQDVSKPLGENFRASSLMSSQRETSSWVQRRE
ncbi:hypothetical protein KUCAC02_014779 [Chaenocephalus aceratus]|uniref:Uncharacterized protein n=1 Tax=Chaenocephalus aceratus TaxID=36190 RepID=A0ACB9WEV5_CHAAC|nr:hypothetical protein KUCAC02_014779 [Chaenocephalus aceratus]